MKERYEGSNYLHGENLSSFKLVVFISCIFQMPAKCGIKSVPFFS